MTEDAIAASIPIMAENSESRDAPVFFTIAFSAAVTARPVSSVSVGGESGEKKTGP
jgi:hypothetical protein